MAYAKKHEGKLTGQWIGEVSLKSAGKRFRHSFETKREAEAYEAFVRTMGVEPPTLLNDGKLVAKGRSFKEVAALCKAAGGPRGAWARQRDPSLGQRLEYAISRIGEYDISDVTRALVREKIIEPLRKAPATSGKRQRKQGTINRYVTAVSAVLTWAVQENLLEHKPTLEFKKEVDRDERHTVDPGVEDRAVQWLEDNGHHVVAVCVRWLSATGMRRGEMLKLSPEQIKDDHVELTKEQTKTDRPRLVYVRPELCRQMRPIVAAGSFPDPTHLLRTFQTAIKAGGSESHAVLHGLRHTRNTRLRKLGVEQGVRMKILGHTSAQVNDGYDHVDLEDQRKIAELEEQMRGEKRGEVVQLASHNLDKPAKTG